MTLHPSHYHLPLDVGGTSAIEALGSAPTKPTTAKRSHHHLVILIHHRHNNEYNINTNNKRNTVSATNTQEKYISSPRPNRNGMQCHQLSRIPFFSIQFFSNLFYQFLSLLRTTRCGILLNHRTTTFKQN